MSWKCLCCLLLFHLTFLMSRECVSFLLLFDPVFLMCQKFFFGFLFFHLVSSNISDVSGMCIFSSAVWSCLSDVSEINFWFSLFSSFLFIWFHPSDVCLCTADIAPWLLFNICLMKNFSRWDGSLSCNGLEFDECMPSVDTVLNWVSAIKGDIYVKNVAPVFPTIISVFNHF